MRKPYIYGLVGLQFSGNKLSARQMFGQRHGAVCSIEQILDFFFASSFDSEDYATPVTRNGFLCRSELVPP